MTNYICPYEDRKCEVPFKNCPHWQGTFCEFDLLTEGLYKYEESIKNE
nr:MAG TPA: hypothetical protein [Bacteriophage sp.]